MQEDDKKARGDVAELREEIRKYRDERRANAGGRASSSRTGGAKPPWRAAAYPKSLPSFTLSFSPAEFDKLLPPGVRSHKEAFHGRWRLFWREGVRRSKSAGWDLHGWEGSVKTLLGEAWREYTARTGLACPFQGVA